MAFTDVEESVAGAQPLELYTFTTPLVVYRYTSGPKEVVSNGQTFIPLAGIARNEVKSGTQEEENIALDIELPFDNELVQNFAYKTAPPTLAMRLERAHLTDPSDTIVLWTGKVMSFRVEGRIAKLRVPSLFSFILNGIAPRPQYMAPCNHVLYDQRCGVLAAAHQQILNVTQITNNIISVSGLTLSSSDIAGGELVAGAERRMIISSLAQDITVSYPFSDLAVGAEVTIRKGCDHSFATCKAKFNNGINYGGCPAVPGRNPFVSKL